METGYIWVGLISALGMILIIIKLDIQKIAGYDLWVDIAFTGLLAYLFAGTYSGMVAAMIAGIIVSAFLFISKKLYGYKRLQRDGLTFTWQYHSN